MSGPAINSRTPVDLEDFEARLRRAQPSADPHSDPLAELARLVEGQRQPFVPPQSPRFHRDVAEPQSFAPQDREPVHAQQARVANEWDLRGSIHDVHPDTRGSFPQDQYGETVYPQPAAVPPPPGAWRPEEAVWENEAEPRRRSRVALYAMGGALCVVLAGIGGTYFLRGGSSSVASAPTIKAVTGPLKVAPDAPAPSSVSSSSASVLDKSGEKLGASKVVASEEQPVDLSQVRAAARPAGAFPEPIKVKTVTVRPDGTIITAADAPGRPASAAVAAAAPTPTPAAPPRTVANVTGSTPAPVAPVAPAAAKPVATTPAPAPAAKTTARVAPPSEMPAQKPAQVASATPSQTSAATPAVAKGGFAVQLAAAGSEAEARDKVGKYQRQFASSLDGHSPGVVKGEANGKSVWRIRVGGLSREDAVSMCVSIKDTGGSCFVAAN